MTTDSLNIRLRRIAPDDAELVHSWRNQPTTLRFQASPRRALEQIREMLVEHSVVPVSPEASGRLSWIVEVDGMPAGTMQFTINGEYDRRHNNAHLGYMIGERYQGRGVASAALDQLLDIAFDPHGLAIERVEAVAAAGNIASRKVLEKCGFTFEGIRRKLLIINGERVDHACYARLVTD